MNLLVKSSSQSAKAAESIGESAVGASVISLLLSDLTGLLSALKVAHYS